MKNLLFYQEIVLGIFKYLLAKEVGSPGLRHPLGSVLEIMVLQPQSTKGLHNPPVNTSSSFGAGMQAP